MGRIANILKRSPRMLTPVVRAYEQRLLRFGPTARGVFWKDADWQVRRYVVLTRIFDADAAAGGITIHDFGCGYGSLFEHLADEPVMLRSRYIGTDMSRAMIEAAKSRINDPRAHFVRGLGAVEDADYTLVSGTYNMHMGADPTAWAEYIKASLMQIWARTRRGLAFNLLNDAAGEQFDGLYYANPQAFLDFARDKLSADAEIVFDPPLPDFTVFVRRSRD